MYTVPDMRAAYLRVHACYSAIEVCFHNYFQSSTYEAHAVLNSEYTYYLVLGCQAYREDTL